MASSHHRRLHIARGTLAALFLVVIAVVAGVLFESWRSAERARTLRHQLVAERLFDGMERELSALLSREDGRAFVEYRPLDGFIGERPDYAVGWFQIDPDGRFALPHPAEDARAERLERASMPLYAEGDRLPNKELPRTVSIKVPVPLSKLAANAPPKSPPRKAVNTKRALEVKTPIQANANDTLSNPNADNMPVEALPVENTFNLNAVATRATRAKVQRQTVSPQQLAEFTQSKVKEDRDPQDEPAPEPMIEEPVPASLEAMAPPEPQVQASAPTKVWIPVEVEVPRADEVALVDVLVGAMELGPGDTPESLLLHRTVQLDDRAWIQGLLIDGPKLRAEVVAASLHGTDLEPFIEVKWEEVTDPPSGAFLFEHRFAAPFDNFVANAVITPLPRQGSGLDMALWITCAILLGATALGLLALHRMLVLTTRQAQEREDFVSAVTHELKSPLTSIRMYSEMLETGVVQEAERRHAYYGTIRSEAERLTRLVDDVLVFSRMERGLPIAMGDTGALTEVVEDVVRMVRPQAEAAGATIEVSLAPECAAIPIDRDALSQVLTNLLDNAVKFSANAGDRRVHVHVDTLDGRARLRVRDHGPGVPKALLRRMFEPFVRGERELTRTTKGTGIGLALVQRLARHLGGDAEARNHPEGGLEVAVWVPATP